MELKNYGARSPSSPLFSLHSADLTSTSDQQFTKNGGFTKYSISKVIACRTAGGGSAAGSPAGGVYSAASAGGDALVAAAQSWSGLSAAGKLVSATVASVANSDVHSTTPYLKLTTGSTANTSAIQTLTSSAAPASGGYRLRYGTQVTAFIAWNANATAVQTALRLLSGLEAVTVSGSFGSHFTITFLGVIGVVALLEPIDGNELMSATAQDVSLTVSEFVGGVSQVTEIQTLTADLVPTVGTYVLSYGSLVTAPISYSADHAALQAALRTIPVLSQVTVSGSFATAFSTTFTGITGPALLLGISQASTLKDTNGDPVTLTPAVDTAGVRGVNEIQRITPDHLPASGQFNISFGGETTAALPYNATPEQVQAELALFSGLGSIIVTGSFVHFFQITFPDFAPHAEMTTGTPSPLLDSGPSAVTLTEATTTAGVDRAVTCDFFIYGEALD